MTEAEAALAGAKTVRCACGRRLLVTSTGVYDYFDGRWRLTEAHCGEASCAPYLFQRRLTAREAREARCELSQRA